MKYNVLGKTKLKASVLGLGTLRLPMRQSATGNDYDEAVELIRYAINNGINYIDTAHTYLDGYGESIVGEALQGLDRSRYILTSKCPVWEVDSADDFDRILYSQLRTLKVDYIDFYLFHALGKGRWRKVQELNLLFRMEDALNKGLIKHIGFSFHDEFDVFKDILLGYDGWELCQIQYNYIDINRQAGTAGINLAKDKGVSVIVMEPLLGGRLAAPPIQVRNALPQSKTAVQCAFDFLFDNDGIDVVLSGIHSKKELDENILYAANASPNMLTDEERQSFVKAKRLYETTANVLCTGCGYCLPCANGLDIPKIIEIYNKYGTTNYRNVKLEYEDLSKKADSCLHCEKCHGRCPQNIKISHIMHTIKSAMEDPLPELNLKDMKIKWPEKYKALLHG